MDTKIHVSWTVLIMASITALTESQGGLPPLPTLPAGFKLPPFPPRPNIPGLPGGLGQTFCDLKLPSPFKDPSIIDIPQNAFPAAAAQRALQSAPEVAAYRAGARQQAQARDVARAAGRSIGSGRSKRQEEQKSFLAPTIKEALCVTVEKKIQVVVSADGEICYTFPEDEIKYFDCQTETANVPNAFPGINKYFCLPENYAFTSFQVFCPSSATEPFRFHTVSIPLNCCGRHFLCDFKPYSAMNGPRYF